MPDYTATIPAYFDGDSAHRIDLTEAGYHDGRTYWAYTLWEIRPDGEIVEVFDADDFGDPMMRVSGCGPEDADRVRSLGSFLSLGEGDTDSEYFDSYTPDQLAWRDANAEHFGYALMQWAMDRGVREDAPEFYPNPEGWAVEAVDLDTEDEEGWALYGWGAFDCEGEPRALYDGNGEDGWTRRPEPPNAAGAVLEYKGRWYAITPGNFGYLDFGCTVYEWDGERWQERASNPSNLSREEYGITWPEDGNGEGEPWTSAQWAESLYADGWDIIDSMMGEDSHG